MRFNSSLILSPIALLALLALPAMAAAQAADPHAGHQIDASAEAAEDDMEEAEAAPAEDSDGGMALNYGSGTARLPANEAIHGFRLPVSSETMVMVHGYAWGIYTDQSGPRGDNKLYVQSMLMGTFERSFTGGRASLRTMISLEPAMARNGYPLLFGLGGTANGLPLVDRQYRHDFVMELAGRVDFDIAKGTSLFAYGGPVGEPALGPSAFLHRQSAYYNPEAPISHRWFDSTHITYGVVTAGIAAPQWQLEASAFRGQQPDEARWGIETPRLDSWSVRASFAPNAQLLFQASYAELKQPEVTRPGENEHRFTTSAQFNSGKGLSAMLAYSSKSRVPGDTLPAVLAEVNWDLDRKNSLFGRFENVVNDELFPDRNDPLHDQRFRISKFQLGYARRMPFGPFELALGGTVAAFAKPDVLDAAYGHSPIGYTLFARLALGG